MIFRVDLAKIERIKWTRTKIKILTKVGGPINSREELTFEVNLNKIKRAKMDRH
jgi:hypothetical protein